MGFVENFKTGGLDKYGLGYKQLKDEFPGLVYCSVTGFGQTGPYAPRPGYDMLIQAMGGIMSITGEPEGQPMKVGISMCDLTAGLHAVVGILAAIRHKSVTGQGQQIDISMLDVTVAMLANQGMSDQEMTTQTSYLIRSYHQATGIGLLRAATIRN